VTHQISRADLFRSRIDKRSFPMRPPWARSESLFVNFCDRTGACSEACEEQIIVFGAGGFPEIDFTAGECTFCGACVDACATDALGPIVNDDNSPRQPWDFHIEVSDACMSVQGVICRVCPEQCDVGAIRFATPAAIGCPEIDEQKCTGCGACIAPCPTGAISIQPAG